MRLSVVFELLLIFLIIAFVASRSVDPKSKHHKRLFKKGKKQVLKQSEPNKYCSCSAAMCNCCRDFNIPVVQVRGPGCATVSFLKENELGITMKFGERVVRNITLSGRKPRPVCMGLPGGVSKFCGRMYGYEKQDDHFKACLGLELRSLDKVEAALRVSCFRFGPGGMKVSPAEPFPESNQEKDEDDEDDDDDYDVDDDDDDDDDFGLSDDDDDDDDDDNDDESANDTADNDVESTDYTGFSALSDEFLDGFFGSDSSSKKKKKPTLVKPIPTVSTVWPEKRPVKNNPKPIRRRPAVAVSSTTPKTRVRLTTPKIVSTTTKSVPPSPPPTVMETPIETTEKPTENDNESEKEEFITSTMMTITSMQVLKDKEQTEENIDDISFTTTEQTTVEDEQTETYTEEMKPTDRVETIKELNEDTENSSNVEHDDKSEEEEEEDDEDDDDVDVSSVVSTGLLDDDDEEPVEHGSDSELKNKPEKEDTIGMLEGILDEMDDDEEEEKKKIKDKQRNIPPPLQAITERIETTYESSEPTSLFTDPVSQPSEFVTLITTDQSPQTTLKNIVTPPPLGGMRLYFSDPRHPPKGRSPLSARSGREHRRMRLPTLETEVVYS